MPAVPVSARRATVNHSRRLAAAVLAAALLAAPLHAAGKKSDSLLTSAWGWLYDILCEDNGHVIP